MNRMAAAATGAGSSLIDRALRARLLEQMQALRKCQLTVIDEFGETVLGQAAENSAETLRATVRVHANAFYRAVALNGSVGAGESFIDGDWDCDDLVALIRMLVRNRDLLDAMETGLARFGGLALRAWYALRRNTRGGSRTNIAAHYDVGNDFFRLFLDDNLMYSSAIYADANESLETASTRKLDRICRKLELCANDRVVEIGSGWGGFALHAARHFGCHVTTTTISRAQYELARERVAEAGLEARVTVLLEDYRDLEGQYDKLVSIEMVEAVGHQYLDAYFTKVGTLLAPHGVALVQAYIPARDARVIRCEVMDGKLLYALALDGAGSTFDLCPADVCMVDKPTITISRFHPPAAITAAVEKLAAMSGLDVGGIEYMVDDRDGRARFYDLNAMSNFVAKPLEVLGWDPHERLVDWLVQLIAAQQKAAA